MGAVQSILTDLLGMSKVSGRWVPRKLTEDQKRNRLNNSRYLLSCYEDLWTELWPRVRLVSITLIRNLNLKKFKRVSSAGRVMASIFWDNQGVIMVNYLEKGHTINGAYYAEELRQLQWEDDAPAHMSQVAMAAVTECHLQSPSSSPVFSRFSLFWLLSVPKAEN